MVVLRGAVGGEGETVDRLMLAAHDDRDKTSR